jgi:hypothetical protein
VLYTLLARYSKKAKEEIPYLSKIVEILLEK